MVRFVASGRCLCGAVVVALFWGVSVRFLVIRFFGFLLGGVSFAYFIRKSTYLKIDVPYCVGIMLVSGFFGGCFLLHIPPC